MLKNTHVVLALEFSVIAATLFPWFCNSVFAQTSEAVDSMIPKSSQVVNLQVTTMDRSDKSLNIGLNLEDSSEPYNPPDNGGPKRTQGSGTRNM